MITNQYIQELITCPKKSSSLSRAKFIEKNRSRRCEIDCYSQDDRFHFTIFLRQSIEFIEDFSVGLIWKEAFNQESTLPDCVLIRCQGPHDGKSEEGSDMHHSYHTHTLTEIDVREHRYTKPSKRQYAETYSSFQEAIYYFEEYCGMIGLRNILLKDSDQLTLYDD